MPLPCALSMLATVAMPWGEPGLHAASFVKGDVGCWTLGRLTVFWLAWDRAAAWSSWQDVKLRPL